LAIVQEMVKVHSGKIIVESTERQGTIFRITMPKGQAHLPSDQFRTERKIDSTRLKASAFIEEATRWLTLPAKTDTETDTSPVY